MPRYSRFSYKKLKKDPTLHEEDDDRQQQQQQSVIQFQYQERPRSRRIRLRKRWRFKVPRLRKFFRRFKKRNLVWAAWAKIVRRLKESQAHFGDLFAGNYIFLQVTPQSLKVGAEAQQGSVPPLHYLPSGRTSW